jgi:hypothetical protein
MKTPKSRVIQFALIMVFMVSMIYANYYAVKMMMRLGVEIYFYDKLQVAYTIGGENGIKKELKQILADDKMPGELALAKNFEPQLKNLKDPGAFLNHKVRQGQKKVKSIRDLRSIAIIIMFIMFSLRLMAKARNRFKSKVA